jgi:hypothetical protein
MELIIGLIALIVLIFMIRKAGVRESNRNLASNLQPPQNIPQYTSNTQNIPQNTPPQNNSNALNDITKAGLIGTATGLGLIGAGMLLNRNNYYNPYEKPDTALAEHLHDLIWHDDCNKCDNDIIYNTFSSCDDTGSDYSNSSCSSSWDDNYNNNHHEDGYSWNSWDSGDSGYSWNSWDSNDDGYSWNSWDSGDDSSW